MRDSWIEILPSLPLPKGVTRCAGFPKRGEGGLWRKTSGQCRKNEQGGLNVGNWLQGKRAIVIGERDGVQGPAIAKCLKAAGAEVIFLVTECFV